MYCITICAFLNPDKYSPMKIDVMYKKCMMVFFLQIVLSALFYWHLVNSDNVIQRPEFSQQCVRLMCAFLMHLYINPEVSSAISIMKFLKYNKDPNYSKN